MASTTAQSLTSSAKPLRFRGLPDSLATLHLEASECCLIHVDNPLSDTEGVWVNPAVRTGYSAKAYDEMKGSWPSTGEIYVGWMRKVVLQMLGLPWKGRRKIRSRVRRWISGEAGRQEKGVSCVINEMQVLVPNGWAHVWCRLH